MEFIGLNTHTPPFDRKAVRQALNYAVDRRQVVKIYGGPLRAVGACRVLMPGFPGYQPRCPYVDADGLPDLSRARHLVTASGTKGMAVGIWAAHAPLYAALAHYLDTVLTQLGYRPKIHTVKRPNVTERIELPRRSRQPPADQSRRQAGSPTTPARPRSFVTCSRALTA